MIKVYILIKKFPFSSEPATKPDREPIDDLSHRDKADPQTKSTEAAKARNEIQPGHLRGSLELWNALWYILVTDTCGLTIDSWFSKEYVHNGNVFLVGVVKSHILKKLIESVVNINTTKPQ